MRMLHVGLRISDPVRSVAFYTAVGYAVVGTVEGTAYGTLTMLQLPGDDFVTIELVHDPASGAVGPGKGLHHTVIQVESLDATRSDLSEKGIEPGPVGHTGGPTGPRSCWLTDPDGYRIEVVQWPDGHAEGITAADFA